MRADLLLLSNQSRMTGQEVTWDGYLAWRESISDPGTQQRRQPGQLSSSSSHLPGLHGEAQPKLRPQPLPNPGAEGELTGALPENETVGMDDAPLPMSFSAIAELISTGNVHLIPNNKVIPDGLNVRSPSPLCLLFFCTVNSLPPLYPRNPIQSDPISSS